MPKRRQQKVLASVPEDEELIDEAPTVKPKELDESILQRIDGIEQQGEQTYKSSSPLCLCPLRFTIALCSI